MTFFLCLLSKASAFLHDWTHTMQLSENRNHQNTPVHDPHVCCWCLSPARPYTQGKCTLSSRMDKRKLLKGDVFDGWLNVRLIYVFKKEIKPTFCPFTLKAKTKSVTSLYCLSHTQESAGQTNFVWRLSLKWPSGRPIMSDYNCSIVIFTDTRSH